MQAIIAKHKLSEGFTSALISKILLHLKIAVKNAKTKNRTTLKKEDIFGVGGFR